MNVSEQIINVLNDLCQKFGIAIDWSAANVLPYLKELLTRFINWEIATSWVWMIIGGVFLLLGIFLIVCEICNEWMTDGLLLVVGIILAIPCAFIIGCQVFDIVEATYLPEKTIYDFITYQTSLHN